MPDDSPYRVYSGTCPDEGCQAKLYFPSFSSIECTSCGQRHDRKTVKDIMEVTNFTEAFRNLLRNYLIGSSPKKGAEMVQVKGLSNYHCKLLSPLLTTHGMDKSGKAKPLSDIKGSDFFDCSIFCDRAFLIDPEHIEISGYGRDISGSIRYLKETLGVIQAFNDGEERLLPIHVDGDGHCLVHAVSRALIGRELFWHPLRVNLQRHLQDNLHLYKELVGDFVDENEWSDIIEECDPEYTPPDGDLLGLRNMHIFGLANVLKRPIILLDSMTGMNNLADYAATFLPALIPSSECCGKTGEMNKPLCLAWSSSGYNHYIPLVGVRKGEKLPRLPRRLVPKAWGVPDLLCKEYIDYSEDDSVEIGGGRSLGDAYLLKLAVAMDELFIEKHGVHPALVADVHHYIYKRTGVVSPPPNVVLSATRNAVQEGRLYLCITCDAVCELTICLDWFKRGGALYKMATEQHGELDDTRHYHFPVQGFICSYRSSSDELVPDLKKMKMERCTWCHRKPVRLLNKDRSVQYENGDRTRTPAPSSKCPCGKKHWWEGVEYDNLAQEIPVGLTWAGNTIEEKVTWFQYETDPRLNSNVFEVAAKVVQKHFPGVFGSERLVQQVVDQILYRTKKPETEVENDELQKQEQPPSKIILAGTQVVHKEELTKSQTEKKLRERIPQRAAEEQRRASKEAKRKANLNSNASHQPAVIRRPVPAVSPQNRIVRVTTSSGAQGRLTLDRDSTYGTFLSQLQLDMGVNPAHVKKILAGFPPRNIADQLREEDPLPLQHGERVQVELISRDVDGFVEMDTTSHQPELSDTSKQDLLQLIQNLTETEGDMDLQLKTLALTAMLTGQSLWSHVQSHPDMLKRGGLLYRMVEKDAELVNGRVYSIPGIPGKMFRYNQKKDELELSVESRHPVASEPLGTITQEGFRVGSSGVVVNPGINLTSKAFQGQGRTLGATAAAPVHSGGTTSDGALVTAPTQPLLRKGPGYSVLNQEPASKLNRTMEVVKRLTEQIQNEYVTGEETTSAQSVEAPIEEHQTTTTATEEAEKERMDET